MRLNLQLWFIFCELHQMTRGEHDRIIDLILQQLGSNCDYIQFWADLRWLIAEGVLWHVAALQCWVWASPHSEVTYDWVKKEQYTVLVLTSGYKCRWEVEIWSRKYSRINTICPSYHVCFEKYVYVHMHWYAADYIPVFKCDSEIQCCCCPKPTQLSNLLNTAVVAVTHGSKTAQIYTQTHGKNTDQHKHTHSHARTHSRM